MESEVSMKIYRGFGVERMKDRINVLRMSVTTSKAVTRLVKET